MALQIHKNAHKNLKEEGKKITKNKKKKNTNLYERNSP